MTPVNRIRETHAGAMCTATSRSVPEHTDRARHRAAHAYSVSRYPISHVVPTAAGVLACDQRIGRLPCGVVVVRVAGGVEGVEEGVAHRRRARRLHPDHRRRGFQLAPASRPVREVRPDIATLGGDLLDHEARCAPSSPPGYLRASVRRRRRCCRRHPGRPPAPTARACAAGDGSDRRRAGGRVKAMPWRMFPPVIRSRFQSVMLSCNLTPAPATRHIGNDTGLPYRDWRRRRLCTATSRFRREEPA